jgi:acetyltransferase-like isoleucine patch superfamily enzyme
MILVEKLKQKFLLFKLSRINGFYLKGIVHFRKMPIIDIHLNARITIGNNTLLNSDLENYHLSLYSRCKLMADKAGASIEIGANTRIHGSCIHAFKSIKIGDNCLIAGNVQIFDCNAHDLSGDVPSERINTHGEAKPTVIEDNVWLGTNVVVLPGVTVGEGSVITANSVVHKDIPSGVMAGGNPAVVIKNIKNA